MSKFCTNCGTSMADGLSFCTSCGMKTGSQTIADEAKNMSSSSLSQESLISHSVAGEPTEVVPKKNILKSRISLLILVVVLIGGASGGAFALGKSSVDKKEIEKTGYNIGFSEGNSKGYDRGFEAGKTDGLRQGCLDVFSFSDGVFDHVIPYNPYASYNKYPGGYYTSRSNC